MRQSVERREDRRCSIAPSGWAIVDPNGAMPWQEFLGPSPNLALSKCFANPVPRLPRHSRRAGFSGFTGHSP